MGNRAIGKSAYINLAGTIDLPLARGLIAEIGKQYKHGATDIHLWISSLGGNVDVGFNLYHALKAFPAFTLTTHNVGQVSSIANIVFFAGSTRYACPNTAFGFHRTTSYFNATLDGVILRTHSEALLRTDTDSINIIHQATGISLADAEGLLNNAQTLSAEEALVRGIITEVRPALIPPGNTLVQVVPG